ncbi:MAG: hypothetical protein EBY21_03550 [Alphaproteobacteria bacterium]|nr:hypothetical protein [Alphaproteobacteria bacterium]
MKNQTSQVQQDWSLLSKKLKTDKSLQQALEQIENLDGLFSEKIQTIPTDTLKLPYAGAEPIAEPRWKESF